MNNNDILNAALGLHNQGNLREAEKHYRAILGNDPNHADALHYLGVIAFQVGQHAAAVELISQSINVQSQNAPALSNLANAYQGMQDFTNAVTYYEKSLILDAKNVQVRANLGNALKQLNRLNEAQIQYEQVLQFAPQLHEVKRNLAEVYAAMGKTAKAVELAKSAIGNAPPSAELSTTYGNILQQSGDYHAAIAQFEKALSLSPQNISAKTNLGKCLSKAGDTTRALELLDNVAENSPENSEAQFSIANLHYELGQFEQAIAYLEKAIALNSDNTNANAYALIVKCMGNSDDALKHIHSIESLLKKPSLDTKDKIHLSYCLGNYYEKVGDFDTAFMHFETANKLSRQQFQYNVEDDLQALTNIKNVFNSAFFANNDYVGDNSVAPIFIVGMPRSGSTLVEQIISSHSQVVGAGEVPILANCIDSVFTLQHGIDCTQSLVKTEYELKLKSWEKIASRYSQQMAQYAEPNSLVCDKLLMNFFHIGIIKLLFPNAIIIHCTRNPVATCWSIFKSDFSDMGHSYGQAFSELARFYTGYKSLMRHWHSLFENHIIEVNYESMVADQEAESKKLIAACKLEWEDTCLAFYKNKRRVGTLSAAQVRRPIYQSGVASWQHFETHITELIALLEND